MHLELILKVVCIVIYKIKLGFISCGEGTDKYPMNKFNLHLRGSPYRGED